MSDIKSIALATASLLSVGLAGAALMSWTWQSTSERIISNEREYRLRVLNEIVPAQRYDNVLFEDHVTATDPELLGSDESVVYRARKNGLPVAAILNVTAPAGYSGPIRLLVGVNYDGTLAGVRVTQHRETPGLGDNIEAEKSDWIFGFQQRSLGDPPQALWTVRSEGGAFDQFTGATITPRAVVTAVRNALLYFDAHREELFAVNTP